MLAAVTIKRWARPLRLTNDGDCRKVLEGAGPLLDQGDVQAARSCIQLVVRSAVSRHILRSANFTPSLLMPPACSTTKESAACGCACALPYLGCPIAAAAIAVASGMWHTAGQPASITPGPGQHAHARVRARVTTDIDGQVTSRSTSTWLPSCAQLARAMPGNQFGESAWEASRGRREE